MLRNTSTLSYHETSVKRLTIDSAQSTDSSLFSSFANADSHLFQLLHRSYDMGCTKQSKPSIQHLNKRLDKLFWDRLATTNTDSNGLDAFLQNVHCH